MTSNSSMTICRRTRQSVFWRVRIIPVLKLLYAFLLVSVIDLCQPNQNHQHYLAKALLPDPPFTKGRIRHDVHKGTTLLKDGINYSNINLSYNNNDDRNTRNEGNFIPAHEQLLSSTNQRQVQQETVAGSSSSFAPLPSPTTPNVTPLKVMIFIDGTWLYYSIYERIYERDVIAQKLGKYWRAESTPDWSRLPTVACQALLQDPKSKWSAIMPVGVDGSGGPSSVPARPIEVSRVSVYSSMHRDTPTDSFRYKMFADMIKAGFDVNMMETVGKGEKCVDIQLAVDMLYYATVPDAYDVALLLTGDRDFLPAVIRCRQKGRRIGLVSMRSGSLAFEVTPNLKDYDTIWLEDYLSEWIRKKTPEELSRRPLPSRMNPGDRSPKISAYTLKKVITNFITKSGVPRVSSRDMGRHLKALMVGEKSMLDEIKAVYGGLYQFLVLAEIYLVEADSRRAVKAFWVSLQDNHNNISEDDPQSGKEALTQDEKEFLREYEQWVPHDKNKEYEFTVNEPDLISEQSHGVPKSDTNSVNSGDGSSPSIDYSSFTVPELKEICREKGLRISAKKKIELIERIEAHAASEKEEIKTKVDDPSPEQYLESLILEYLHASGGQASSRDVGRYLAANKMSPERRRTAGTTSQGMSALTELKENYVSLNNFVKKMPNLYIQSAPGHEFNICVDRDL